MIEVLVAILIVSIASMATFTLLSDAARNAQRAKSEQIAIEYAEQELEYLRSLEDKKLALTVAPPHSANPESPNYRVSESTFALNRSPVGNYRNLVINGGSLYGGGEIAGGTIEPGPTPFVSGNVEGRIYRYIVWHNDESCSETQCPGKQDYKQIIVVAKVNKTASLPGETGYFEVQSNFIDPTKNAEKDPLPKGAEGVVTAQQFFLSDTPCAAGGTTVRQEITADHPLHNTLGECASGLQTGATPGAPDALLLGSPPSSEESVVPPVHEYSNNLYTEPGLQLVKQEANGCNYNPTTGTNPASEIHRWVSDPMAERFVLNGRVSVELFTGTTNGASYRAGICMYLFDRHKTSTGYTDTYFLNNSGSTPYWTYVAGAPWPSSQWTSVRRTLELKQAGEIPVGDRLGFAVSTEKEATTAANAISVMYDHPSYPSRIEVDTNTPINGG
ncbi:MAG: type II secretion system protein [Actinobacteria bacterium]|nr:type II secretion system protein [Actinomycetota bacterium]